MASYFAKFEKEYQEKMEKQSAVAHKNGVTNTRTNDDNEEEEALSQSTFIDPDEQEILAAIRRDQEEARIEFKKEQAQRSATLAREEAARNAAMAQEQQLAQRNKYCKYGIIGGAVFVVILITIIVIAITASSGNKSSASDNDIPGSPIVSPSTPPIVTPAIATTNDLIDPPFSPIPVATLQPVAINSGNTNMNSSTLPTEQQLTVACNFLNYTNVTACKSVASFDGSTVGNTIPTELGLMTHLTVLRLFDNQLTGTIPSTLGQLTQLTWLDFYKNQLIGTIPSTLGQLTQLNAFILWDNQLTGTIPSTLGQLTQLTKFALFHNAQLNGFIPSSLCSISGIDIRIDCANIVCSCCTEDITGTSCSV